MPNQTPSTVADIEGPWIDSEHNSGLIQRCKLGWNIPITELSNEIIATYLRQRIALSLIVPEAKKRVAAKYVDDSELHDEELANALQSSEAEKR